MMVADGLLQRPDQPGKHASAAMALAVHVALAVLLIYGVHWQAAPPQEVEVELVRSLPSPSVEHVAQPTPPVVETKPPAQTAPAPPVARPDIAVKSRDKPKPVTRPESASTLNPMQWLKSETEHLVQQKEVNADLQKINDLKARQNAAGLAAWTDKVKAKIRGNVVRVGNAEGNPEAVYEITLLPDGSVVGDPRQKKSTGNAALDNAIETAILKSSPLPKPDDASIFQRVLTLKVRPFEE
jgi:colicin import membrane protein